MADKDNLPSGGAVRPRQRHTAGALDIRNVIGGLLGIYGLILLGMAAFGPLEEGKTGGVNANLWAGIVLVVAALVFLGWARLRPVVVEAPPAQERESGAPLGKPE